MPAPTLPWDGGCRCGRVRLKISSPPLLTSACHCTGCRSMSASAFSLSVANPSEDFAVVQGEPVIGGLHGHARHFFCPYCMSWMFTRPAGIDFFVNVRATMLDEHGWFSPYIETYVSEKLPWATTPAVHSFETFPPMEDLDALLKAFGAANA